jgi:hypothetical protein
VKRIWGVLQRFQQQLQSSCPTFTAINLTAASNTEHESARSYCVLPTQLKLLLLLIQTRKRERYKIIERRINLFWQHFVLNSIVQLNLQFLKGFNVCQCHLRSVFRATQVTAPPIHKLLNIIRKQVHNVSMARMKIDEAGFHNSVVLLTEQSRNFDADFFP